VVSQAEGEINYLWKTAIESGTVNGRLSLAFRASRGTELETILAYSKSETEISFALEKPDEGIWLKFGRGSLANGFALRKDISSPLEANITRNVANLESTSTGNLLMAMGTRWLTLFIGSSAAITVTDDIHAPYFCGLEVGYPIGRVVSGFSVGIGNLKPSAESGGWKPEPDFKMGGASIWAALGLFGEGKVFDFRIWGAASSSELDPPGLALRTEFLFGKAGELAICPALPFLRTIKAIVALSAGGYRFPEGNIAAFSNFFSLNFILGEEKTLGLDTKLVFSHVRGVDQGFFTFNRTSDNGCLDPLFGLPNHIEAGLVLSDTLESASGDLRFALSSGVVSVIKKSPSWRIGIEAKRSINSGFLQYFVVGAIVRWNLEGVVAAENDTASVAPFFETDEIIGGDPVGQTASTDGNFSLKVRGSVKLFESMKLGASLTVNERSGKSDYIVDFSIGNDFEPRNGTRISISLSAPGAGYSIGQETRGFPDFSLSVSGHS
jgi:hypothetical protein